MSDANIKDMFYILIAILTIYPLIEFVFKKKHWAVRMLACIFIIFFWFISCKYKRITDREAREANTQKDSLSNEVKKRDSTLATKADSSNILLKNLKDSFHIILDANNKPIFSKEYKNTVNKPPTVNFDQR